MGNLSGELTFKVYLWTNPFEEPDIRIFKLSAASTYSFFSLKLMELFPHLKEQNFSVLWTDDEKEEVTIRSDDDLQIALSLMPENLKKFNVVVEPTRQVKKVSHPGVWCDVCGFDVTGIRYKCLLCDDYDLCMSCENSGNHPDHPMIKLPHPASRSWLQSVRQFARSQMTAFIDEMWPRRHHCHGDRKKRRESEDSEGEADEGTHKRSHKKGKKASKCPYAQAMNESKKYCSPVTSERKSECCDRRNECCERKHKVREQHKRKMSHISYLRCLAEGFQKIFDPLEIDVEMEVRPSPPGEREKKDEASKKKTVRFSSSGTPENPAGEEQEILKKEVDDLAESLSKQSVSGRENSPDEDGWEMFKTTRSDEDKDEEEEEREPKRAVPSPSAPEGNEETESPSGQGPSQNIYPNLDLNSDVTETLTKLLEMGFSTDIKRLLSLIEQKKGNVADILEILLAPKNNGPQ